MEAEELGRLGEDGTPQDDVGLPGVCDFPLVDGSDVGALPSSLFRLGDGGGGMATALGIRALGVPTDIPDRRGLGVANGEDVDRDGEDVLLGGEGRLDAVGVTGVWEGVESTLLRNSLAVIFAYLAAREPVVIFELRVGVFVALGVVVVDLAIARSLATRAAGVSGPMEGVVRPLGVMRPFGMDGVCESLPLYDVEGVMRPEEMDGVTRPPREEATDGGRWDAPWPTVAAESFVDATKTPHFSGHVK